MIPHIGNKLWAMDDPSNRRKFLTITFVFGVIMPAQAFGGVLARLRKTIIEAIGCNETAARCLSPRGQKLS